MAKWVGYMGRNQEEAQMLANSPCPLIHSHGIAECMVCRKLGWEGGDGGGGKEEQ